MTYLPVLGHARVFYFARTTRLTGRLVGLAARLRGGAGALARAAAGASRTSSAFAWRAHGMSERFVDIMRQAKELHFSYVLFDLDA